MRATGRVTAALRRRRPQGWRCRALCALLAAALAACSANPPARKALEALPPLQVGDRQIAPGEVRERAPTPDLLAVDDAMRDFVQRYTGGVVRAQQRLINLHSAVLGAASLGIRYDPAAEGSAREVFHRGTANCLSYATLFVALAREAGLDADYQWLKVRPEWSMRGERVQVRLHVNVLVKATKNDRFMVDIEPVPTRDIADSRTISDRDAEALYHANIAMDALAADNVELAWIHSVRALQLSPDMPHLWVNLGATYRYSGQHRDAERSYLYALELDPRHDPAMNNLVVLYAMEGREAERAYWDARVASYREDNPYYHAWLGDQAADADNWRQALEYYERAVELLPDDSRLLYALGLVHVELNQPAQASAYLRRAIEHATLRSDINAYETRLQSVQRELEGRAVEG